MVLVSHELRTSGDADAGTGGRQPRLFQRLEWSGCDRGRVDLGELPRRSGRSRTVPAPSVGTFRGNAVCNLTKSGERWSFPRADQSRTSLLLTVLKPALEATQGQILSQSPTDATWS